MNIRPYLLLLLASLVITGCDSCGGGKVNIPRQANPNVGMFGVAMVFGDSDFDNQFPFDPCKVFRNGDYPIRSVKIEVFSLDANGNEVTLFKKVYRDGTDFRNGNPGGLKFNIPEVGGGAWKVRTTVVGYDCSELPDPSLCLACCEDMPIWESTSPWHESTGSWIYVEYPIFDDCF